MDNPQKHKTTEYLKEAHARIIRRKGSHYAPNVHELQTEIDAIESDAHIAAAAIDQIPYNDQKRSWWIEGAKWYRDYIKNKQP